MVDLKAEFEANGYVVVNIEDEALIDAVNKDVDTIISEERYDTNTKIYSYNDSPRIVSSYKLSENCAKLAKHPKVMSALTECFKAKPLPFSTINFVRTTQQPLHSDYAHFGTFPELLLAGTWVALEDIDPRAGPLQVVPGSHKFDIFEYAKVMDSLPTTLSAIKSQYSVYEEWIKNYIERNGCKAVTPKLKKGDCIIWAANLLHGSPDCMDNRLSRRSQVTHWSFEGVEMHYNPNFSSPSEGKYAERDVSYF